jgi:micrococcal nuclease
MDTPEAGDPFYAAAKEANADLVSGKNVILVKDVSETDRFDRLLRYVNLEDGTFVNAELVSLGYAQVATFPPDVRHVSLFLTLQREAREAGRGLWGVSSTPTATTAPPPTQAQPTSPPASPLPTQPLLPTASPPPTSTVALPQATATEELARNRDPAYPDVCIAPPPDLNCGDIPHKRFRVLLPDPHRFHGDSDEIGCESWRLPTVPAHTASAKSTPERRSAPLPPAS